MNNRLEGKIALVTGTVAASGWTLLQSLGVVE